MNYPVLYIVLWGIYFLLVVSSMYFGFKVGFNFGIRYVEIPIDDKENYPHPNEITLEDCDGIFSEVYERDSQYFAVYRLKFKGE